MVSLGKKFIVKFKHSNTPESKPSVLEEREIGINIADKVMHYRPNDSTEIREFDLKAIPDDLLDLFSNGFVVIGQGLYK